MKISRKKLKEIIKEHLDEATLGKITQEAALSEEQVPVTDVETLVNLLRSRSGEGGSRTEARLSPTEADQAVALLSKLYEAADKGNVYAICTAQVGREDKEKYEKCVKSMAKKPGYHK